MGRFLKNNPTITLNVLYVKKMNLYSAYISKHNLIHDYLINDCKQRRMALSCSKKTISIIKRNNLKT